jgi:hypothetical protein
VSKDVIDVRVPSSMSQSTLADKLTASRSSIPGSLPWCLMLVLFGSPISAVIDAGKPGSGGAVPLPG